ncbi:hypothetical protein BKA70DRAFT_297839 [Coprinopsis sp. MPI-PUGE-AT-0042]|nr:hypothetical protein BKA70DRAFT_297839 [Coprinopsis sp. MPI-PUGE-AT-0042]
MATKDLPEIGLRQRLCVEIQKLPILTLVSSQKTQQASSKLTLARVPNSFGYFLPICVLQAVRADLGETARRRHAIRELLQCGDITPSSSRLKIAGPSKGTVGSDSRSTPETMDMRGWHNEHDQSRSYRHHHRYHHFPMSDCAISVRMLQGSCAGLCKLAHDAVAGYRLRGYTPSRSRLPGYGG